MTDSLNDQARRRVRVAQVDAVVQLVPLTMTVNLLNAGCAKRRMNG